MWVVSTPPRGVTQAPSRSCYIPPCLASTVLLGFVLCKHWARAVQLVTLHEPRVKVMMVKP